MQHLKSENAKKESRNAWKKREDADQAFGHPGQLFSLAQCMIWIMPLKRVGSMLFLAVKATLFFRMSPTLAPD